MKLLTVLLFSLLITACSSTYKNNDVDGQTVPRMLGQTLEQQDVSIPDMFTAEQTLLLVGYKQDTQFDIDRWLIALDMTETRVDAYEIPAIQGMLPRMFKTKINDGMRAGIPKELWKGVITLYEDGETMQAFTGNENANNARVILINQAGEILYFYDRGFSVPALNQLRSVIL
ncbi:hypothetical protein CW745_10180 [Psychromonas sp. psych-6C06]|uniref:hypothetical protein n=1 Tax=Psychromonas sp. psych-6C06 TaxID=2058089 RepID=UPI000C32F4B3|nr:hypothetical protein [Psychromonas sp. psych-6C06]PKF61681.1 hypothetical protein CW745_10180 [Psychromonas sp. psych-6C06]